MTVCVFSSLCQYYSMKEKRWSSEGLVPLEGSTLHSVHCLTQHLTMFGASLFVHPGVVVLLPPVCDNTMNYNYFFGRILISTHTYYPLRKTVKTLLLFLLQCVQSKGDIQNVVAGIVCAILVLIYLVVGLITHKLDHLDNLRVSQVPLCGRPGLYHYRVLVKTGWRPGAGQII